MEPPFLHLRAEALAAIRGFLDAREVLEVETSCLESAPVSDLQIEPIAANGRYLRVSPEFAMKRLLAVGSGDIYQIGKVFRAHETGALHNPEFTMLEWYRCGWNYRRLMDETDEFLHRLFGLCGVLPDSDVVFCREIFADALGVDPWCDGAEALIEKAREAGFVTCADRSDALDCLTDEIARTRFRDDRLAFVGGYPPEQALLARVTEGVAERFEVYLGPVELVNGYTELNDAGECRRFSADNDRRSEIGRPWRGVGEALLNAFEQGLPDCAGASLGLDRVLMCMTGTADVAATLAFDWDDA